MARRVPTLAGGYLPWLGGPGGTYLSQGVPTLSGGTYLGWGVPTLPGGVPTLAGGTYLGGYIPWSGRGYPPWLGQHREYLLCGRQYASCIHVGGLSCL